MPHSSVRAGALSAALLLSGIARPTQATGDVLDVCEVRLTHMFRLEDAVRCALDESAELMALEHRRKAREATSLRAGLRPAPEVSYEQWGVPLTRSWNLAEAQMLMVGVTQAFPTPSLARSERRVAEAALPVVDGERREWALALEWSVREAVILLRRAEESAAVRTTLIDQAVAIETLTKTLFESGHGTTLDLVRARTEANRARLEWYRAKDSSELARARLNTLLGRHPEAALGPVEAEMTVAASGVDALRPELLTADARLVQDDAAIEAARRRGTTPTWMVKLQYQAMPMEAHVNGYGAMVGMTLPWLDPGREAWVKEAEATRAEHDAEREALRRSIAGEEAAARVSRRTAAHALEVIETTLLPAARQAAELVRAGFASGRDSALSVLDALRTLVTLEQDRVDARAALALAELAVDRANGRSILNGGAP